MVNVISSISSTATGDDSVASGSTTTSTIATCTATAGTTPENSYDNSCKIYWSQRFIGTLVLD